MVAHQMGAFRQDIEADERPGAGAVSPARQRWIGGLPPGPLTDAEGRVDRSWPDGARVGGRGTLHARRLAQLARAIRTEIVPRLVLAGRCNLRNAAGQAPEPQGAAASGVQTLAGLLLARESGAAAAFVEALHRGGLPLEALYLNLLAPTARRLGQLWDEDLCSVADVMLGLQRLRSMLHVHSAEFAPPLPAARGPRRRALLVPVPGEQHGFGLAMVAEFFRRAAWDVRCFPLASRSELVGMVARESFALLGFSVGCDNSLDALATAIRAVRRASCNPAIGIMVGGPAFIARPKLVALVGADATAVDGRQATLQAESLLRLLAGRA